MLYRLIASTVATLEDFQSHRNLDPERHFSNATECELWSVSLWTTVEKCRQLRKKRPHKGKSIATVRMSPATGVTKAKPTGHVSWWRCAACDPLPLTAFLE